MNTELRRFKINQRAKLFHAVKIGKVTRPTACSECEADCNPQGHHYDYDKALDVMWLCKPCHESLHTLRGDHILRRV